MSRYSGEWEKFLKSQVSKLETVVNVLVTQISSPSLSEEAGLSCFRFLDPTSLHLQILKAVRIVSGLHASIALLEKGFTQEIGVLIRTIHDFITEIEFLHDAHTTDELMVKPQEFVDLFFEKQIEKPDLESDKKNDPTVARRHIRAGSVRTLMQFGEQNRIRRILEKIDEVFSGYVHGAYPNIMELYQCNNLYTGQGRFLMEGMLGTPRIPEFRWQLASLTMKAGAAIHLIATATNKTDLMEQIKEIRTQIEKSDLYLRKGTWET